MCCSRPTPVSDTHIGWVLMQKTLRTPVHDVCPCYWCLNVVALAFQKSLFRATTHLMLSVLTVSSVVIFNQAGFGYLDLSASFRNSLVTLMVDIYPVLKKSVAVAACRHIRESYHQGDLKLFIISHSVIQAPRKVSENGQRYDCR